MGRNAKLRQNRRLQQVAVKGDWRFQARWDVGEMIELSKVVVPPVLAREFAIAVDSESCYVPEGAAIFPATWPYEMRCVEFYEPAMRWVAGCIESVPQALKKIAITNAVRMLAVSAIWATPDWEA